MENKKELTVNSKDLSCQQNTRLVHQIIFIDGFSGIGKTTLAKKLFEFLKKRDNEGVYIEQNMIAEFIEKSGRQEDETLYALMVANIKEFAKLGFKDILALDFNPIRFRDIPQDFVGYDYIILHLICKDKQQNINQMKNRGQGLIDLNMLSEDYAREARPKLPNEYELDVTGRTPDQVFDLALQIIDNSKSVLEYKYTKPDKKYFGTWVQEDK